MKSTVLPATLLLLIATTFSFYAKGAGTDTAAVSVNRMTAYEYWFDNDFTNRTNTQYSDSIVLLNVDVSSLLLGLHTFSIRFLDAIGNWSAPTVRYFLRPANSISTGNNSMTAYEYWFDSDFQARHSMQSSDSLILLDVDAANLLPGLHTFSIRFEDSAGNWSAPTVRYFLRPANSISTGNNSMTAYEYWFDSDFQARHSMQFSDSLILLDVDAANLLPGLHTFSIRFEDSVGNWSAPTVRYFLRPANSISTGNNSMTAYEYWFDSDYTDKETGKWSFGTRDRHIDSLYIDMPRSVAPLSDPTNSLDLNINTSNLLEGVHTFCFRARDRRGLWSSPITQIFVKPRTTTYSENKITAYQYWFNDSTDHTTTVSVDPRNPFDLNTLIAVNSTKLILSAADTVHIDDKVASKNALHIRFKDSAGLWSQIETDSFLVMLSGLDYLIKDAPSSHDRLTDLTNPASSYQSISLHNGILQISGYKEYTLRVYSVNGLLLYKACNLTDLHTRTGLTERVIIVQLFTPTGLMTTTLLQNSID